MSELMYEKKNGFDGADEKTREKVFEFCKDYKKAITTAKTEREFCRLAYELLEQEGFVRLESKEFLKPGDRVYSVNRGKGVMAAVIGSEPLTNGTNIVGAHIDSPRLDLKPNPLYEDSGMAYFKTHYYGGIRKYQWFNIPLSLHGVVVRTDGTQINISVGESAGDPIFCIPDLLPHLAQQYAGKKLSEAFDGEKLNVIVGNIECGDAEKSKIKYGVMKLLNEKYGICEADFMSAELELVPAFAARDLGLDRSMVCGYGQDDRVCAYTALRAAIDVKQPKKTAICLLVDKEEIGSMGNTGMKSRYFENTLAKMCSMAQDNYSDLTLRECMSNSACLSADVGAAFDSNFPETCEKNNCAFVNCGLLITKYTGSRGKGGSSDASAELVARIRRIFDENGVLWQTGELGKVDLGGGGTIAQFVANLDIDVVDSGVALLGMHSPNEVAGKYDIYMAYKGYKAFMND